MDELLQKAIERRDRLRTALTALDNFIASYGQIQEDPLEATMPLFEIRHDIPPPISKRQRQALVQAIVDDAERFILAEGRPLTRGQLVQRLQASGHSLDGRDKNKVLGTNLWRSGKFHNLKGAGYWPKVSPVPQSFAALPRRETLIE